MKEIANRKNSSLFTLVKKLRKRLQLTRLFAISSEALIILLFLSCVAALFSQFNLIRIRQLHIFLSVFGLAFIIAGLTTYAKRISAPYLLLQADQKQGLHELLSSAYEFENLGRKNELQEAVCIDAYKKASTLQISEVFPLRIRRRYWSIPLLLIAFIVLSAFDLGITFLEPPEEQLTRRTERLEEQERYFAQRAGEDPESFYNSLSDDLKRLREELEKDNFDPESAEEQARGIRERIGAHIEGLERSEDINTDQKSEEQAEEDDQEAPRRILSKSEASEEGLDIFSADKGDTASQSKEGLDESFGEYGGEKGDDLSEEVPSSVEFSDRKEGLSKELKNLKDTADILDSIQDKFDKLDEGEEGSSGTGSSAGNAKAGDGADKSSKEMGGEKSDDAAEQAAGASGSDAREAESQDKDNTEEDRSPGESSAKASVEGRITQDENRKILLRSLPDSAEAKINIEESIQEYSRVVEEAILREEIPSGFEKVIEQYFLKLGMINKDANERKGR